MLVRTLREKLDADRPVLGTFVKFPTPAITELLGLAGFDFVIIDTEHGALSHAEVENLIRAAEVTGLNSIVRTPDAQETNILHALDAGASGVQIPSLSSAAEVAQAIRRARFHPDGQRGYSRACRAGRYGHMPLADFFADAREALVVVHVENREMVEDIEALCALEHLDVVFFGAGDLSQSLGHPGETRHPLVTQAFETVVETARRHGRQVGAVAASAEDLAMLKAAGVNYVVWKSDVAMFLGAAQAAVKTFTGA